jgi:tetratricopeptide (TPR) repeat protein
MPQLTILHVPESDPPEFRLRRERDGKATNPIIIPSPYARPVGEGDRALMDELRWYLENFLEYPFEPWTDRADRTLAELEAWGTEAFDALFGGGDGRVWLDRVRQNGDVQITVSADDPHVLSWPWEGLYDPCREWLVHQHAVTRRLNDVDDPPPLPDLPDDRVNVLLVTARPLDEDAPYRSIARPLVETVKEQDLPASITVLRPPTFDHLRDHLREHPGRYHLVHFDGHGGYLGDADDVSGGPYRMRGPEGHLVFETDGDFDPDPIPARRLSRLLREHQIPAVVLNACQSGMVDDAADDAFASVAASLLRAGVRSVTAMSHAVLVTGAQAFVPPFYRRLFESGSLAKAVRAGRREMVANPERVSPRGRFPLQDWLVPVIYEQADGPFELVEDAAPPPDDAPDLPDPPEEAQSPYGFVGRDRELLQLERAMQRAPAGILFHGLGGIGKTTLLWGFLQWIADTGGLDHPPFWLTFSDIRSAEFVLNRFGERFYEEEFATMDPSEKVDRLVDALDEHPHVLVWDNFESATAMDEEAGETLLSADDRETLRTFLHRLRGTGTKVLITSRNDEDWLGGPAYVQRHTLGGLQGEERWRFCEEIVADLPGVTLDRADDALKDLMDTLRGHPLAMRLVLPRLANRTPDDLEETVRHNLDALAGTGNEARDRLYATLGLVEDVLGGEVRELLPPLRLHERFVDANMIKGMAEEAEGSISRDQIDQGLQALSDVGLLENAKGGIYSIHPALTGYLRTQESGSAPEGQDKGWVRAFVNRMAVIAAKFAPKPFHENRLFTECHETNIANAKRLAEKGGWMNERICLVLFLASSAKKRRLQDVAKNQYEELLEMWKQLENEDAVAATYHELGVVAQKRRDLEEAEKYFQKSAEIRESHDDEQGAAKSYHQLGTLARKRQNLEEAERWLRKSAEITERYSDEQGAALSYKEIGILAQKRRDFEEAEKWLRKSVEIQERHDDEHGAAKSYHALGILAQERQDFEEAEKWFEKSMEIKERHDNKYSVAKTYGQRGKLARECENLRDAGDWFLAAFWSTQDHRIVQKVVLHYVEMFAKAPPDVQSDLRQKWIDSGIPEKKLDDLLDQIEE